MADPSAVSVVIPAYNEADVIGEVVAALAAAGPWREIIVVDDGSSDDTAARAAAAGATVVRHPYNKGNGAAVKSGIRTRDRRVRPDHRRRRSAPAPTMPGGSSRGSASTTSSSARAPRHTQATQARRFGNGALNWLASYLTGRDIPDLTSGFRGARREYLREFLHLLPNGFSTPTTTTLAFIKAGYNVAFEPAEARPRVGAVEDPARARRREVLHDHPEDRDALQPAARVPADQPSRRSLLGAGYGTLDGRHAVAASRTARCC